MLDSNKVSSLASSLSYASFVDVAANAAPANTGLDKPLALTLTTFDHFTYDLKIGGKTPENDYNLTVAAAADFPTQRTPARTKSRTTRQKLDKEFQDKTKALQDKLAREKSFSPWVYVVSSSLVEPLIRGRAQLLVDKKEDKPADAAAEPGDGPKSGAVEMPGLLDAPGAAPASPNTPP